MAIGMLSGCGSKSIDGEKTVATVDGTDIPMGVVSLYARESQAQTVAMYKSFMGSAGNIWSQVVDEDAGTTSVSYTHLDVYKRQSSRRRSIYQLGT